MCATTMGTAKVQIIAPPAEAMDWRLKGLCRNRDTEEFFYPDGERGAAKARRERAAKAICKRCPVIEPCGDWALARREQYGIYGGMTEKERAAILDAGDKLAAMQAAPVENGISEPVEQEAA